MDFKGMHLKKSRSFLFAASIIVIFYMWSCRHESSPGIYLKSSTDIPFIFVGGYPRSGTTLMVDMLFIIRFNLEKNLDLLDSKCCARGKGFLLP